MKIAASLICAASLATIAIANDEIGEIEKLVATDADDFDRFGTSISFSLTRTTVGAPFEDTGGNDAGAVYVFSTATGQQLYKLLPSDSAAGLLFGQSVASTGQSEIIGAPGGSGNAFRSGAAYVFRGSDGSQRHKLIASDGALFDDFGASVASNGARAIVGSPRDDDDGVDSGSVYIFDLQSGQQINKLTANDAGAGDRFGSAVDASGSLVVVGAPLADVGGVTSGGAVYIFDESTGQQLRKLTAPVPQLGARFGDAVAIGAGRVVVGARFTDGAFTDSGVAYVFDANTGDLLYELTSPSPSETGYFGISVSVNVAVVVGAEGETTGGGNRAGAVYVFDRESGQQIYKLTPSDAAALDNFGGAAATLGRRAFVGADGDDDGGPNAGAAYIFDITPCYADVNDDKTVNLADLNIVLASFGQTTTIGDTNFDGVIDLADLNRVLSEFGIVCP